MATWKREFKLPWCKAGLLILMIKWTRTSRLSTKISLSTGDSARGRGAPVDHRGHWDRQSPPPYEPTVVLRLGPYGGPRGGGGFL